MLKKTFNRRSFVSLVAGAALVASLGLVGCGSNNNTADSGEGTTTEGVSGSITAVGSTALQPLAEAAAE